MTQKKLFLSIPMSGVESSVIKRYEENMKIIQENSTLREYEVVVPIDLETSFDENGLTEKAKEHDNAYWMGKDIEILLRCDAIYSCPNWSKSKGCRTERATAEIYGLEIYGFPH